MKTRLGIRLKALLNAIPHGYDSIWDLCCDHGRLGMALLETERTPKVHFIDQISEIMADLGQRLVEYGAKGYQLHRQDAATLELPQSGQHLLLLAGVGDEVTNTILADLTSKNPNANPDWLISPANNLYQVRGFLRAKGFGLLKEGVVFENHRGYEWLMVTKDRKRAPQSIPPTGVFWDTNRAEHRAHLLKLVKHGRQRLNNPTQAGEARAMLELYQRVLGGTP